MLIAIGTFAGVLALVYGTYWCFVVRAESRAQAELLQRLNPKGSQAAAVRLGVIKQATRLSTIPPVERALGRATAFITPLQQTVEQSGLRVTIGTLLLASGCLALLTMFVVTKVTTLPLVVGLASGLVVGAIPYAILRRCRTRRTRKFEEQFPEAIDLIARALRAGHAFTTGLGMAGEELPDPVGTEFKLLYERQNFGQPLPDALRSFAERIPLLDARFFVTAVLTQREAGGNLSEVLDNLASVIRERFKVKRQVRVVSAHGRLTGGILIALPPVMAVVFLFLMPDTIKLLWSDPMGVKMVWTAVVLQIVGTLVMRKLINVEY